MEKYLKLFFVALFAALSFSLTSCGDDDDDDAPDGALAGKWQVSYYDSEDGYITSTIEFISGSRCRLSETYSNYPEDNFSVEENYSISGDVKDNARLRIWGKTTDGDPYEQTLLITVSGDKMTMYDLADDETMIFTRV